jgi:16S rRNA (guanine966-N2)-methyltransferase
MRIISGIYKGRKIQAVAGKVTRPTIDRVREAWISTLATLSSGDAFAHFKVLDAFAGSGALGLELLSRGAASCVFLEQDKKAYSTLRSNINSLQLPGRVAQTYLSDSLSPRLASQIKLEGPFDLVVLDPPYKLAPKRVLEFLESLANAGLLAPQALISYEHAEITEQGFADTILETTSIPLTLKMEKSKVYGTVTIDYYRCCALSE